MPQTMLTVSEERLARAFDAWLDAYQGDPEAFRSVRQAAIDDRQRKAQGDLPKYGQACVSTLKEFIKQA